MRSIQEWIQDESQVLGPEFLRVDGILNHRVDPAFVAQIGEAMAERFGGMNATCVMTAEAAGNIVAYELARQLGIRALYAKKGKAATMIRPVVRSVVSPTKGTQTELAVSSDYLNSEDRVLIVDDFLYHGVTSVALADMVLETGASLAGFGFVIEKVFAGGRSRLERFGVPIVTLARIRSMNPDTGSIEFAQETT